MMKVLVLPWLVVISVGAFNLEFQSFKLKHGKTYRDQIEETKRFKIFQDNLRAIEEHNALYEQGLVSYKQGVNKFTDTTKEEFQAMLTLSSSHKPHFNSTKHIKTGLAVPESVDWRNSGQITGVKDQGNCGSCWAFSITGSVEAAYYRNTGNLVSLSEQQLVDCSTSINDGCGGGYLGPTLKYLIQVGIESEETYPYTGKDDPCRYKAAKVLTNISGYKSIIEDEVALLEVVATVGPISVLMDATDLSQYESGIYTGAYNRLNHAVLVVGYGTENDEKYWIVKNSWGAAWGESGYFRIARGQNECGISEEIVYATI